MTRWHGDTSFATFCLARGQAGTFGLIFPACPRESKSSEITDISVTLSPRSGYFRIKTQRLTVQKSVTYEAKVRDLRSVIHWLTDTRTKKIYEKVWATMSKYEQLWIAPSPFPYLCNVVQRYAALPISKTGEDIWWNRLFNLSCDPNQQAVPQRQAIVRRLHPLSSGKRVAWWERWSLP